MSSASQLFVRSNIHVTNLDTALKKNLQLEKFVDVTLSCEGRKFRCHRLILAAASPLFESLFLDNPAQHPVVIIPYGIKAWTLQALIEFMYKGHVNVSQYGLSELVYSAELLQITGLENARKDFPNGTNENWTNGTEAGVPPDSSDSSDADIASHNDFKSRVSQAHDSHIPTDVDILCTNSDPIGTHSMMTDDVAKIRVKSNKMLLQNYAENPREALKQPENLVESSLRNNQEGIVRTESTEFLVKCEPVDLATEEIECHPNMAVMCSADLPNDARLRDYEERPDPTLEFDGTISTDIHTKLSLESKGLHRNPFNGGSNCTPQILAPKKSTQRSKTYEYQFYDSLKTLSSPAKRKHKLYQTQVADEPSNADFKHGDIATSYPDDQQTYHVMEPTLDTVILRSPRGNQPRSYSTQSLYNALMAVKHGESIYRASREFIIPRKTLRNWMKRWNIKSQFPMPKQLKDAAIRKKIQDN